MGRGKVSTKNLHAIRDKQIVLDTSIIIFLANADFRTQIISAITQLENQNNALFVSEITLFELNKSSRTNADCAQKARLLKRFTPLPLDQNRALNAGILFGLMNGSDKTIKNKEHKLACDLLIGGTVIENNNALFMTSNLSDFSAPLWKKAAEGRLIRKVSDGWALQNWFLLEFDYSKMPDEFLSEDMIARYKGGQARLLLPAATQ